QRRDAGDDLAAGYLEHRRSARVALAVALGRALEVDVELADGVDGLAALALDAGRLATAGGVGARADAVADDAHRLVHVRARQGRDVVVRDGRDRQRRLEDADADVVAGGLNLVDRG